jgi:hypothetical protein
MAQDYQINVKVKGLGAAANQLASFTDDLNAAREEGKSVGGALDAATGGALTGFRKAATGIKTFIKGLNLTRAAIIATGVGALVVALTSVVVFFTKTKKGAEALEVATAGLGAVMEVLTSAVATVGEFLYNAFTAPGFALNSLKAGLTAVGDYIQTMLKVAVYPLRRAFLEIKKGGLSAAAAIKEFFGGDATELRDSIADTRVDLQNLSDEIKEDLTDLGEPFVAAGMSVKSFVKEVVDAADKGMALANASIKLRQAQRDLQVQMANTRKEIKAYNLIAEDTTKGFEERLEAADKAIALEQQLMADRKALAKEELRIHQERVAIGETLEEDLQKEAELKANVAQLDMESLELQTTLNNKRNTIEQQRIAQVENIAAMESEMRREQMGERAKQEAEIQDQLQQRIKDIDKLKITEQEAEDLRVKAREAANAKMLKLQEQFRLQDMELAASGAQATFDLLKGLTKMSEKDTEASAKKAFNRNKAISIAETLVSTYVAAQKAYASQLTLDPTAPIRAAVAAGIAITSGLAKVAAIKSTQFNSTGGSEPDSGGGGGSISAGGIQSVGVDVGSLVPNQQNPTPEPVRAYVVENEISNKQALNRELQIRQKIPGVLHRGVLYR